MSRRNLRGGGIENAGDYKTAQDNRGAAKATGSLSFRDKARMFNTKAKGFEKVKSPEVFAKIKDDNYTRNLPKYIDDSHNKFANTGQQQFIVKRDAARDAIAKATGEQFYTGDDAMDEAKARTDAKDMSKVLFYDQNR